MRLGQIALFHPDYTVGSGITPDLLTFHLAAKALAGFEGDLLTAGGEFHPALRIIKITPNFLCYGSWRNDNTELTMDWKAD